MRQTWHSNGESNGRLFSQASATDRVSPFARHAPVLRSAFGEGGSRITHHVHAFTLIELILVMTILAIAVSFTAPALANFFRGRSLDYEARRLLALTRQGQSRAVSEGLPMELWFDTSKSAYGLEAEPSYEAVDSKAISFAFDSQLQIEFANQNSGAHFGSLGLASSSASGNGTASNHPNVPKIRFLPDGSVSDASPQAVHLIGRDGVSLWLMLSRSRLNYEIRTRNN